jgi:hypothetical protein
VGGDRAGELLLTLNPVLVKSPSRRETDVKVYLGRRCYDARAVLIDFSTGPSGTTRSPQSHSIRVGTVSGERIVGAGRLARTAANWRPVSGFSPFHTSFGNRWSL